MLAIARKPAWLATALALSLGGAPAPAAANPSKAKPATILTEQSRGAVTVRAATPVEIRLPAQAGTGFSWVPKLWAANVTALPPLRGSGAMPGGTQIQRFRFMTKRPGTYPVSFSYEQPWRGGTKGARTKSFLIIVR